MPSRNIFGGQSARALFAHYVYEELRKREFVSLLDVLCIYYKREKSYYDLHTYSSDNAYKQCIPAEKGFYQDFFNNIIGVTREKGAKVEQVVISTKTEYQHGLLLTKPLHHNQKETLPFGQHEDGCYGEVTLTIESNRELRGRILMYGQYLEVVQPQSLREQIVEILKKQVEQYSDNQ